jgi:hypothetical protein
VQEPQFAFASVFGSSHKFLGFAVESLLPITLSHGLLAAVFQRALMSKSVYQVRRSFQYATLIWFIIVGFLFVMALLLKSRGIDPADKNIWTLLSDPQLSFLVFPGFKGLAACAIVAMGMSTADSYSQAGGVHVYDMIQSLQWKLTRPMTWIRMGTLVLGLLSLCVVLTQYGYNEIRNWESFIYTPLVVIPLLFTIFGFRTSPQVLLISLGCGVLAMVGWEMGVAKIFPSLALSEVEEAMPGFVFMPPILLATHYLLGAPGGWVGNIDVAPVQQNRLLRQDRWARQRKRWQNFNLAQWLSAQQPSTVGHFFWIGIYGVLSHLLAAFSLDPAWVQHHAGFFYGTLLSVLLPATFLMTYAAWPPFMQGRWVSHVGYLGGVTLPLLYTTPLWLWMSGGSIAVLYLFYFINLLLALYLLDARWVLCHTLLGWWSSYGMVRSFFGEPLPNLWPTVGRSADLLTVAFSLFLLVASCWLIILSRHQWQQSLTYGTLAREEAKRHAKKYSWLHRQIGHIYDEYQLSHAASREKLEKLLKNVENKPSKESFQKFREAWKEEKVYVDKSMESMVVQLSMQYERCLLPAFLNQLEERYRQMSKQPPMLVDNTCGNVEVVWDLDRVYGLLIELMKQVTTDGDRLIWVETKPTTLCYPIGKREVKAVAFSIRQGLDTTPVQVGEQHTYEELPKAFMEDEMSRTISAHYGLLKQDEGACSVILPCSLKGIRPSHVHDAHALPQQQPSPTVLREAQEVETAFWQKVLERLPKNENEVLAIIQRALRFMKYYHGPTQRKSGSLYYTHPILVCMKVMDHTQNSVVWIAALLHDVVEDSQCTLEEVGIVFGQQVKGLVEWVSSMRMGNKKYKLEHTGKQAEKIYRDAPKDAKLIKLCDRLHNLETLGAMPPEKQQKKLAETEQFFIPMAKDIGEEKLAEQLRKQAAIFKPERK